MRFRNGEIKWLAQDFSRSEFWSCDGQGRQSDVDSSFLQLRKQQRRDFFHHAKLNSWMFGNKTSEARRKKIWSDGGDRTQTYRPGFHGRHVPNFGSSLA